ncbi:MAG: FAD-dependent oxidoreductase, partial [Candidatus Bathyarchaeia archaeon]
MQKEHLISTDVLVIGGGVAGCFAAIEAKRRKADVIIVDKAYAGKSGSSIMASGWWGYLDPAYEDVIDEAIELVSKGGDYINNREWTKIILKESYSTFQDIISWGVELPVKLEEVTTWWKENIAGGVRGRRGDPGRPYFIQAPLRHRKVAPALRRQAEKTGVKIIDRVMVVDLIKSEDGRVAGAAGFSLDNGDMYIFRAKATVLAAGWTTFKLAAGYHNLSLTGDAEAMAYRAGVEITGKEFQESLHFNLADFPYAWKSNAEIYPAYWRFVDAEGEEVNFMKFGPNSTVFAFHAGKGPIYWDFDDITPEEKEAIRKYIWKRGNPIELERVGFDPLKGGKYRIFGG